MIVSQLVSFLIMLKNYTKSALYPISKRQNSAVYITQDSIGYLWIATQDGLNKYDGREFFNYPYLFVDITKPNYSNLGKVYTDRKGNIWIIPINKTPYKLNSSKNEFQPVSSITDASIIFQDSHLNLKLLYLKLS